MTVATKWRENGEEDPHGDRYDCKREELIKGQYTDDEMANAVYLEPNIGNLTAAKDRIRWLSRKLEKQDGEQQAIIDALMLEYCHDEMTQDQKDNWAKHQRPVI